MTKKIFRSILFAAALVLLVSLVIVMGCLYAYFSGVQEEQLCDELTIAAAAVEANGGEYLSTVSSDRFRLTLIDTDGTVLCDTKVDPSELENHAEREEVKEAFETGEGESTRYSSSLTKETMNLARRLSDGTVLRISSDRATVAALAYGMIQSVCVVVLIALVLSFILADKLAKRIVKPINSLDLEHPLENDVYEELSPLLGRLERQHRQLGSQLEELRKRAEQFREITASMREALVLLDENNRVLSLNDAAKALFSADDHCLNEDVVTLDRSLEMTGAVASCVREGHAEFTSRRGGRVMEFRLNRIASGENRFGTLILAYDVTAKVGAEQLRREFTANVSHELKTPLQGIIGSCELLENGMVQKEDEARFLGHIHKEAQRLISLTGDIIRLSELDEGVPMPKENTELLSVVERAAQALSGAAEKKHVSIHVSGSPEELSGVPALLYEIAYNLIDNAVKYNREGGSVSAEVGREKGGVFLTVSDTGIGIAPDQQERIFERFYRVDKSRSKESGGTGLGLSIVKHAAEYHHAEITLTSEIGSGTSIRVLFPEENV